MANIETVVEPLENGRELSKARLALLSLILGCPALCVLFSCGQLKWQQILQPWIELLHEVGS